jgi:hypothetical protein
MGFFKIKKSKTTGDKDGSKAQGSRRAFQDDFNWKENAKRNLPTRTKKRSMLPDSGKVRVTDYGASPNAKKILHMDMLFNLGTKHLGETPPDWLQPIADSPTSSTPPGPIPFGSRHDERLPRQTRSRKVFEDDIKEKGTTPSDDGHTVPTSTSCSVLEIFSQYTETLCTPMSTKQHSETPVCNNERVVSDNELAIMEGSSFTPFSIPREISYSKSTDESEPTGYRVLETMEELQNQPPSLLERLDLRKKKNLRKVKVYVDKPKPKKHSSAASVYSALTTPSGVGH